MAAAHTLFNIDIYDDEDDSDYVPSHEDESGDWSDVDVYTDENNVESTNTKCCVIL